MSPQNIRVFKALVIFLGVIIVLGTTALVIALGQRIKERGSVWPEPALAARVTAERLAIPPGATVLETDMDGGRVALRLALPGGGQAIYLYDLRTGEQVGTLAIAP